MASSSSVLYSFVLVRASNLSPIGTLSRATNRQFSVGLNQAGECQFTLPIYDRMADAIEPLSTAIIIYRNYTAIWGGPVLSIDEDGPSATIRVTAKGWFHILESRIMRMTTPAAPGSSMTNTSFSSSTTGWAASSGSGTITRDTVVFDTSSASLRIDSSSTFRVHGLFTGTNPAPGQDLLLSFRYRFDAPTQADLDTWLASHPSYSSAFSFGSYEDNDISILRPPTGLVNSTWNTGVIAWTPVKTGLVWNSGTTTSSKYQRGQGSPDCAFRVFFGEMSLWTLRIDSFTYTPASLPVLQKTYEATQACTIVSNIITDINGDASSGITVGSAPTTVTRTRTYKKYDNVGRAIQELSDIENGFDWTINPTTRVLDMFSSKGSAKPNVHFGYRSGPDNLSAVRRSIDGTSLANYIVATGKYGTGVSSDAASISQYGAREDVVSIGDFASTDYSTTLLAVSGAELLFRRQPRQIYAIVPRPGNYSINSGNPVPEPFAEYDVGDTVYFSAKLGRLNVENQAVRVFGISISIDENGVERVNELKVIFR